jgi:hypothetical protein
MNQALKLKNHLSNLTIQLAIALLIPTTLECDLIVELNQTIALVSIAYHRHQISDTQREMCMNN